jgi:hypothetical protein
MTELSPRWAYAIALLMLGCQPDIGDACTTNANCSLTGDRLCDPTSPGGYCTQFNCSPGKCPDEAACVGFYGKLSNACTTAFPEQRFERSFCMKKCESDDDCRTGDGYKCLRPPPEVDAVVLESGEAANASVCMVELKVPEPPKHNPDICSAPDASFADGAAPVSDAAHDATSSDGTTADASKSDASKSDASGSDASEGGTSRDAGIRDARVGQ